MRPHRAQVDALDRAMAAAVIKPPVYRSVMIMGRFRVPTETPMPNRWKRFWYRVLLGWKWEELKPAEPLCTCTPFHLVDCAITQAAARERIGNPPVTG